MNAEELAKLKDYLDKAESFELPTYDHLPTVPLYMEQVVSYVNSILEPLAISDKQKLTSFMVNNYVKAKIISEPDKKKYNVDHLGYLLAISLLKNVVNMNDLSLIISMDNDVTSDKAVLYRFFKSMSRDVFSDVAGRAKKRVDRFEETFEKEKDADQEKAERYFDDSIGLIAFRMSIQASVYQSIAQALYRYLEECKKSDEKEKEAKKKEETINKHQQKKAEKEARKANKKEKRNEKK